MNAPIARPVEALVGRLRDGCPRTNYRLANGYEIDEPATEALLKEAADEIERLCRLLAAESQAPCLECGCYENAGCADHALPPNAGV